MWNSALSDKHFKTQKTQYIHRFIEDHLFDNLSESWLLQLGSGVAMFLLGCTIAQSNEAKYLCLCFTVPAGFFSASIITIVAQSISHIFYRPPSSRGDEIILINPDGNPEMCKVYQYPAIQGLFGYRLPNAGDIGKIALFEEQRQKEEERVEKERQDEFNKTMFNLYCLNSLNHRFWVATPAPDIPELARIGEVYARIGPYMTPREKNSNISPFEMVEIVKKVCEAGEYEISRKFADSYTSLEEVWKRGLEEYPWSRSQIDEMIMTKRMIHIKGSAIEKIQKFLKSA